MKLEKDCEQLLASLGSVEYCGAGVSRRSRMHSGSRSAYGEFRGKEARYHRPVIGGVQIGMLATLLTSAIAVRILNDLGESVSALALQAGTRLLAIRHFPMPPNARTK